jgi:hypothetical protein
MITDIKLMLSNLIFGIQNLKKKKFEKKFLGKQKFHTRLHGNS